MQYLELGKFYCNQEKNAEAEEIFKRSIEINPSNYWAYEALAHRYQELGNSKLTEEYFREADGVIPEYYMPATRRNYQRLKEVLLQRGIKLVCVQYPVLNVESLKKLFDSPDGIIFVDNERLFKEAIRQASYDEYFTDIYGGVFGHKTPKGNRLLAENIASVILKECFW